MVPNGTPQILKSNTEQLLCFPTMHFSCETNVEPCGIMLIGNQSVVHNIGRDGAAQTYGSVVKYVRTCFQVPIVCIQGRLKT